MFRSSNIRRLILLTAMLQPLSPALSTTLTDTLEETSSLCQQLKEERKYDEAIAKCMYAAAHNDGSSERALGEIYLYGMGSIDHNLDEALEWLQRALEHGDQDAYFGLGVIHDIGIDGVEHNNKAAEYFLIAARQGNTRAMRALGMLYLGEEDFPADHEKARFYLKQAWDHGSKKAAYYLADSYLNSPELPDYEQANRWIKMAAASNDAKAYLRMAHQYETGHGVERSFEDAAYWLRVYLDSDHADPDLLSATRAHLTTGSSPLK